MADYIPIKDVDFDSWQENLVAIAQKNGVLWGYSPSALAPVIANQKIWKDAFAIASNKQNRTQVDVKTKTDARKVYQQSLRQFVAQYIAHNQNVPNSERKGMQLTIKSTHRKPTPQPTTYPIARIDFSERLQHKIFYSDSSSAHSKAKPNGIHGCEIWYKMGGETPSGSSEMNYIATQTASPYIAKFNLPDAGKTVYYALRWVNKRGVPGPWSEIFTAMVAM